MGKKSGLFLNAGNTSAIWLSTGLNSPVTYMPHLNMEWNPPKFKVLGIWFTNDTKHCEVINFQEKFSEIKALYKVWLKRQITPPGRVAVLRYCFVQNSLSMDFFTKPTRQLVDGLQMTVYEFVWNRKQNRISREFSDKKKNSKGMTWNT